MALLLSMYQKLRLTRERNQLQLKLTQISAKRKRVTKNMSEIQKRYTSIKQNIDNGIKQLKNQYKLWTQNAVLGGAGTFSPSIFGNTGTSGYVINALSNWATNTQNGDDLYTDKATDIMKVIQSGGTFIKKLDNGQEQKDTNGNPIYVASNDANIEISQDDYNKFAIASNLAQQEQTKATYVCNQMQQQYENNLSIFSLQQEAAIEAEQDEMLAPLAYEDTMLELEETEIKTRLEYLKNELEAYTSQLKEDCQNAAPKFGLA